jgi:hypothetical protein
MDETCGMQGMYEICIQNLAGNLKKPSGRFRPKCEYNIKIDVKRGRLLDYGLD